MREFLMTGKVIKVENKTAKSTNTPYSIVYVEDKDGVVEILAGSKIEAPREGTTIICRGTIRSTPKQYQDRVFYSYSFSLSKFDVISAGFVSSDDEQKDYLSDDRIPF